MLSAHLNVEKIPEYETGGGITTSVKLEEPYAFWNSENYAPFTGMAYGTPPGLPSGILLKP